VKYGFVLPIGDPRVVADLAYDAEQAGWDGLFVAEAVWGMDAWVLLTAAAMRTERIRLGTDLTPLSRMRPWKLASETVTLDLLSNGRVIVGVGLGAIDTGFAEFGEQTDRKVRAELLDEGLDILDGLWRGQPFNYDGKHYKIKETTFYPPPPPVQQPRIPIWAVGAWPRMKSMRRVLRCDGIMPTVIDEQGRRCETTPDDIRAIKQYVEANRTLTSRFDIVMEGETPGDDPKKAAAITGKWQDVGATWWIESRWEIPSDADSLSIVRERILQGPPRAD